PTRVVEVLESEHCRALAQHEAITIEIEWTAGPGRLIVPPRERPHCVEARHAQSRHGGLATAGVDDVGHRISYPAGRFTDGVSGPRTRRDGGHHRPFGADPHGR